MNTQKKHKETNVKVQKRLLDFLEEYIGTNESLRYENDTYVVKFSVDQTAGISRYGEINSFLDENVKIDYPKTSTLTALLKVQIPTSKLNLDDINGLKDTGRFLRMIIKYRSTAHERIDMDLTYFRKTFESAAVTLVQNFREKENLTIQIRNEINQKINFLTENASRFEIYKNNGEEFKKLNDIIQPYAINIIYLDNATDPSNISTIKNLNEKNGDPRYYFCFNGLLGTNPRQFRKTIIEPLSKILYDRFKIEQKLGIIPSLEGFRKK